MSDDDICRWLMIAGLVAIERLQVTYALTIWQLPVGCFVAPPHTEGNATY